MRTKFDLMFRRLWLALLIMLCFSLAWAVIGQPAATNAAGPPPEAPADAAHATRLTFGLDRVPGLQFQLFHIPLWQYLAMLIYVLLAFLAAKVADHLIGVRLKKWAAKTETKWDDLIVKVLHGPIKVVSFVILLHVGFNVFPWPAWLAGYLSKGLVIVVACSLTYLALKLGDASLAYWRQKTARGGEHVLDDQLVPFLRVSLRVFVVIVAVLLTSHNLGLNITSLIASLSIGGLALGLAAQDTLANLFGAVSVFMDEPFRVGDTIRIDTTEGTVESIGLRSTRMRNANGHLVTIPNKIMGNSTIINITRRPNIRTEINLGLTYTTSPEQLRLALAILEEIYRGHPKTADLLVTFNKFADSALNIQVVHNWNGTDNKEYMADMQKLNLAVKERFEKEGLEFAYPSQTLYVKSLPS
jgi:MscS family membrane protein